MFRFRKYLLYERCTSVFGQLLSAQKLLSRYSNIISKRPVRKLVVTLSYFFIVLYPKGKQFQADINRDNPLGFGGSLAVSFAVILRQLWSGQRDSIEPSTLKSLLANRASQFSGYAQHDAQEFMAFLLDGLHEVKTNLKLDYFGTIFKFICFCCRI